MNLLFKTPIRRPVEVIKEGFNRDLFLNLAPSLIPFQLKRFDGCVKGDEVHVEVGPGFFKQEWISLIASSETNASGWSFMDEGKVLPWPLKSWKHHHRVDKLSPSESLIVDDIHYRTSSVVLDFLIKPFLWSVFAIRPRRYKKFFKD
jgi:ligand-binding SRPBCC domain-containing protein